MATTRFFDGGRGSSKMGEAARLKRIEIMKGGKLNLSSAERYKRIMAKKMEEHQKKASLGRSAFSLPGTKAGAEQKLSKRTQQAIAERAQRKAVKEERALRRMVAIKPREYGTLGRIDAKGRVYDQAGNIVMQVESKNGKIKTTGGWLVGKYKPKSWSHNEFMKENIVKWSPYHIRLRQQQQQQQVAAMYAMHGVGIHTAGDEAVSLTVYGPKDDSWRNNTGINGWGAVSNNVHGTYGENVWGTFSDNVWGGTDSNIWGGIGDGGGLWKRGKIWGSGKSGQKNYLHHAASLVIAFFGLAQRQASGGGGAHDHEHLTNRGGLSAHDHLTARSGGASHEHASSSGGSGGGGGSSGGGRAAAKSGAH